MNRLADTTGEDTAYVTWQVSTHEPLVDTTTLSNIPEKLCKGNGIDDESPERENKPWNSWDNALPEVNMSCEASKANFDSSENLKQKMIINLK